MKKLITISLLTSLALYSSQAFDGSITLTQNDNSTISGKLMGDPWFHYVETGGEIAVYNTTSHNYEYANLDTTGTIPKLVPSGVKVGLAGAHDNITPAQLIQARAQARAATVGAAAGVALKGMIGGKIWYMVYDDADLGKQMYTISVNADVDNMKEQRIMPTGSVLKSHPLSVTGSKLNVDGGQFYFKTFTQMQGYLEVKEYNIINGTNVLNRIVRWYDNQADATTYYNSL